MNLPDVFPTENRTMPHPEYYLIVFANGRRKTIYYNAGSTDNPNIQRKIKRFHAIEDTIRTILSSKQEFKNLPKDNRIAL